MTITMKRSPASADEITVRVVTLEGHLATAEYFGATEKFLPQVAQSASLQAALIDLDDVRIAAMDASLAMRPCHHRNWRRRPATPNGT